MDRTTGRREPVGFTMLDLLALVVGSALALAWPLGNFDRPEVHAFQPAPDWLYALYLTREAIFFADLVLPAVVLARRLRYGGMARSAEFAAGLVGTPWLVRSLLNWPWSLVDFDDLNDDMIAWMDFTSIYLPLALAVAAAIGLALGRRRLPGWAKTTALWLVLAGVNVGHNALAASWVGERTVREVLFIDLPFRVIYGAVMAAALRDVFATGRPRPSWVAWCGALLPPLSGVLGLITTHFLYYHRSMRPPDDRLLTAVDAAVLLVTLALGWAIARRFGPAFGRWLRSGYDGGGKESCPEAPED